jgi:hypothetical protein
MANPENDRWDVTDRNTDAASGVADDRSVAPGDGALTEASPWTAGQASEDARRAGLGDGVRESRTDEMVDTALEDRGTFDDPQVRDDLAGTDQTGVGRSGSTYEPNSTFSTTYQGADAAAADVDSDRVDGEPALRDGGGFDDPTAVDPTTQEPLEMAGREADVEDLGRDTGMGEAAAAGTLAGAGGGAMVADRWGGTPDTEAGTFPHASTTEDTAAPTPAGAGAADTRPGSVSGTDVGSLFGESDAQTFQERWREVQLRFVDSPKDATRDGAALLDEAVEKLTASLRGQRDTLMQDSDDTERLRVQLRGYRDILNRILGL